MKNIVKKISAVILSMLIIVSFSDIAAFADTVSATKAKIKSTDWMATVSDDAKFADVNLPGTHDTCCTYFTREKPECEIFAKTQNLSVPEQFNAGVRFMDIRLCVTKSTDTQLKVPHNMCITADKKNGGSAMTMNKVIAYAEEFLRAHPTESIVLMYTHDDRYFDNYDELYDSLKADMIASFRNNKNRVLIEDGNFNKTMGEMRGKLVLVTNSLVGGYSIGMCDYKAATKWNTKVKDYFDYIYKDYVGDLKCVNLSAQGREGSDGQFIETVPDYLTESAIMNRNVSNYNFVKNDAYGWFLMDYVTEDLCRKIYMISADESKAPEVEEEEKQEEQQEEQKEEKPVVVAKLKLSAKKYSSKRIKLNWTSTSSSAKKYAVYAARSGKKLKKIATTSKKYYIVKKASGKKLQKGKKYKFYVVALSKYGKVIKTNGKTLKSSTITIKR